MPAPDASFAHPAHMLSKPGPLPGPGVTTAPAGGQGMALEAKATAPVSVVGSHSWFVAFTTQGGPYASAGTSYSAYAPPSLGSTWTCWFPFREFHDNGIGLQIRLLVYLNAGSSSSMFAAAATIGVNSGGTTSTDTTNLTGEVSTSSGSSNFNDSGWVTLNESVTVTDYVAIVAALKRSGSNNGNMVSPSTILARYV